MATFKSWKFDSKTFSLICLYPPPKKNYIYILQKYKKYPKKFHTHNMKVHMTKALGGNVQSFANIGEVEQPITYGTWPLRVILDSSHI